MQQYLLPIICMVALAGMFLVQKPWLSRTITQSNRDRKFGASDHYIQVTVVHDGEPTNLLFTPSEFANVRDRANAQKEEFTP